jgi:3-oxoacyl-[acyl-carrier protein] reductase
VVEKRALVTGASKGIGRAIAVALAGDGWHVAVHYLSDRAGAEQTAMELGERASGTYAANLEGPDQADTLWQACLSDGPIHCLVNNAGIYVPTPFGATDFLKDYERVFRVNFESPLRLSHAAISHFLDQGGGGKVLNVASRVGFRGEPRASLYAASKAALINLTRSLAVEFAGSGIEVFGLAPGWVDTAMARDGMNDRWPEIQAGIPFGRMATPEDCAHAAAFLLSDKAAYLSGQTIDINGASYFH